MKKNNTMRKRILALAILLTMLFDNSAVSAWAATEEETQVVSDSAFIENTEVLPDNTAEDTGSENERSDDAGEPSQADIPVASPEEVIEVKDIEDYIREQYGEEYVSRMNDRIEADEIPGYEAPVKNDANGMNFVVDLALSAKEHWWQNKDNFAALENNGYTIAGGDSNSGSGGKYIYLGYKYTSDLQANIGSAITGILIRKNDRPASFVYNGKTYYPLNNAYRDSNFNLNQGNDGKKLYIYYTRDGAREGDPLLTTSLAISSGKTSESIVADGYNNGVVNKDQDLNEGAGGDYVYLFVNFHTHTLALKPYEDGHRLECKSCTFRREMEEHEYEYVSISDSMHEGTCKECNYKKQLPHMDSDEDGVCDDCKTPVEARIVIEKSGRTTETGAYKKFTAAWNDAIAKNTDCSIQLLKNINLTSDHLAEGAQHLTPIENGKTITVKNSAGNAQAKITVNGDSFKNFSEIFYVEAGGLVLKTGMVIDGAVFFDSILKAGSAAAKIRMDGAAIHVKGSLNKNLSFITAEQGATIEVPESSLEFAGSRGAKSYSVYGIHVLNGSTADVALATITGCDHAFHVSSAKVNIHEGQYQDKTVVYAEGGSEILIQGGEFTGTDGYCLDSDGAKISIEFGKLNGSLRVGKNQKIVSVLAEGRYAAEIDASNTVTRRIPYAELEAKGNTITFAKRTMIIGCTMHYASEAKYYSRKSHKGNCDFCNQEELIAHDFDDSGICVVCRKNKDIILRTNAGIYEYYDTLEEAIHAIRERTDVTLLALKDIEATDPFFTALGDGEETERKRLTIDLDGYSLKLYDYGTPELLKNVELTIQNGSCEIFDHGLSLSGAELKILNCSCTAKGSGIVMENSRLIVGNGGELVTEPVMKGESELELTDSGKITISWPFTIEDGQSLSMSGRSTFTYTRDSYDSAITVKEGGSLNLRDEALIDVTESAPNQAVHYEEGANIHFAGGGIRVVSLSAIDPGKFINIKVSDFLAPGYAYYGYSSGRELSEDDIKKSNILFSFVVRPHAYHTYNYYDKGDGTHQAICVLCKTQGATSPHVGQKNSDLCAKCNAVFVCTHEFNEDGVCKYCSLQAEACLVIDEVKTFYTSYKDAWKQAKGKKAIIRPLKSLGLWMDTLVIDDQDDITIENGKFSYSTQGDIFVVNGGKLTIADGSFNTADVKKAALVVNGGEVVINGGKFTGGRGIKTFGGTVTVTDGYFDSVGEALQIQSGAVTLKGGSYKTILSDEVCISTLKGAVKDLIPTGYYYAKMGQNVPADLDETHPELIKGSVEVKQHEDHTGYWKEGVCSLCNYVCQHPSFEGNVCSVCGVKTGHKILVQYKEGADSKKESFENLQEALNFACQHPDSELIVAEDLPADMADATVYTIPDESLSVESPIDFTINLGKNVIGTGLSIKEAKVTIKGDGGGISVSDDYALYIGLDAEVRVENCTFRTEDSKQAAIYIKDSESAYLKNVHANGGFALEASDVKDTVTLDGGYYCTASGDEESALQAVAFTGTSGTIKGATITATAEDAAALYLYRCDHVVVDDTRLLIDDTKEGVNSIMIPSRGSSSTELVTEEGSGIYEIASGENITEDYSEDGRISESVDRSVYIGKEFPEKQAQIIGYEPLTDIEFPLGTAIDDVIAKIPAEAHAVTVNYPDRKVKVQVVFDQEEIRKAIQEAYDQETQSLARGVDRVRTKKIDIYAKGIVTGWPEDITSVLEDTINLRLCVVVQKYSLYVDGRPSNTEYFTGDVVELHAGEHIHGKVFRYWDIVEGKADFDVLLPDVSFVMPPENLKINAIYADALELVPEKAATCTEEGNTAYYICGCGQWFRSPEDAEADRAITDHSEVVIPATGHADKNGDHRCDVCHANLAKKPSSGGAGNGTTGKPGVNVQNSSKAQNPTVLRNAGVFTGDDSDLLIWLALLVVSSLGVLVIIRRRWSRRG